MQISFKTVIPLPMVSVYRRFEALLPLRYPLAGWSQPYPIAYTTIGSNRYWFASGAERDAVGAIDDTYRPDLLGEVRYGFMAMTITFYTPERTPLGSVQLFVPEHSEAWTELAVAPSTELAVSYYECWWFIVEVVQTFATQLRQASQRTRQNYQARSPRPGDAPPQDMAPATQSVRAAQEPTSAPQAATSSLRSRSRSRGGRPRNPNDDWAWEQVHVLGRKRAVVYAEWQGHNVASKRSLIDPERSFKHAIALERQHPHDIWAWEQVHLEQRSAADVFAEWQHRNQQAERIVADPERTFAFVTARDRPPGMVSTRST